jgi:hypothetical protein
MAIRKIVPSRSILRLHFDEQCLNANYRKNITWEKFGKKFEWDYFFDAGGEDGNRTRLLIATLSNEAHSTRGSGLQLRRSVTVWAVGPWHNSALLGAK